MMRYIHGTNLIVVVRLLNYKVALVSDKITRYIPVAIQDACLWAFERFQFKALWWHNGCSIISHRNDEVILLKRFCDEAKNDLRGVIYLNNGVTIV